MGTKTGAPLSLAVQSEEFLAELLNRGGQESTAKTYRDRLRYFADWLASTGLVLESVTRDTIQQYLSDLRVQGYSPKSMAHQVSVLRCFFSWLAEEKELLPKNPLARIKSPRVPRRLPRILDEASATKVLDAARTPREQVILELLYGSGVRSAELLGISLGDLFLDGARVLVRGKGGDEGLQPISPQAVEAIRRYLPERAEAVARFREKTDALLVGRQGPLKKSMLRKIVGEVAARTDVDRAVYPHLLRHCFATHLLNSGADLRAVQELLRHKHIGTTQIYTHVSQQRLEGAYRAAHPRVRQWKGHTQEGNDSH